MKKIILALFVAAALASCSQKAIKGEAWIRINQLGYLPESKKVAVMLISELETVKYFELKDSATGKSVRKFKNMTKFGEWEQFGNTLRLDFSEFQASGSYYLEAGGIKSPCFKIGADVYKGTADFLLNYMRQQRCGFNPFLNAECHQHDGYIVEHPTLNGRHVDVRGGWHDATDYLQYSTTSVNSVMQMLFAYENNPGAYGDNYDASGLKASNGIPDIIDEIRWGLDWMLRMNPEKDLMFNQIADDRDHSGMRYPDTDTVDYGWGPGKGRPVYPVTGEIQGLRQYKNRTTGVSSTAGKFASAFALASKVMRKFDEAYADGLAVKARDAYDFALTKPGVQQTACTVSPYFYEEDNWADDMALAAIQMAGISEDIRRFQTEALKYIREEPVTPWMGADTANHYQWYPFVNLAHYYYTNSDAANKDEVTSYIRRGLDGIGKKGETNPFYIGVPFIWCSNNLVAAALTQARYYDALTGDKTYEELEAAMRDWLFGCNPWGTSMIVGLPGWGDYPEDPHSSYRLPHDNPVLNSTPGGLVDGPRSGAAGTLIGIRLSKEDAYEKFQTKLAIYHDDYADYSTNEPTMDGTASLSYYLSSMEEMGKKQLEKK